MAASDRHRSSSRRLTHTELERDHSGADLRGVWGGVTGAGGQVAGPAMSGSSSSLRTPRQNERWSRPDDQRLLSYRENHRNWTNVSAALPGRSVEACKQRFKLPFLISLSIVPLSQACDCLGMLATQLPRLDKDRAPQC